MVVYLITNTKNKWLYFGATTRPLLVRWKEHLNSARRGENKRLYRAMRRHGIENFEIRAIAKAETQEKLLEIEKDLINKNNTYWFGYNDTQGGKGSTYNRPKRGRKSSPRA